MKYGDSHVITGDAIIIWDGVTNPENQRNEKTGEQYKQFNLTVAMPNNAPELSELDAILQEELRNGEFKGNFPAGGHWGVKPIDPNKYEGRLPAHQQIKAVSYSQVQVFDANGQELAPMAYGSMIYPGAVVKVLVSARSYNNVSKGVGFWLSGIQIVNAQAPRLPVGGIDAGAAFGSVPGGPAGGYQPPGAAGGPAGGYQPTGAAGGPAGGYQPPGAAGGPAGVPVGGVAPAPNFLNPQAPVKQMTEKAQGATYDQFIAQGWTDEALIAQGFMLPF